MNQQFQSGPVSELIEASESALRDLERRHKEEDAFLIVDEFRYGPCDGCGTCHTTLPRLRAAIAAVKGGRA